MARYSPIKIINTPEIPQRRYLNLKYPEIAVEFSDIYVYTTLSDRYDKLAQSYYNNSSLWWIIARANISTQPSDSLIPIPGSQIRIPSSNRISNILSQYEDLNNVV
jgi:hypothetical protein